jgi:predicted phosphate transport protein (TIGR00153 family)
MTSIMVMKRFFPKQPDFFKILSKMADLSWSVSQEFEKFLDPNQSSKEISEQVARIEHEADDHVRESIKILGDTFITPIERNDLHALFVATDEVIDLYHAASQRYYSYGLKGMSEGATNLVKLTTNCVREFQELIHRLDEIDSPDQIEVIIRSIHKIEKAADHQMRSSLAALYDSGASVAQIFKERDMILVLERITDQIERVTRLIESIVLDKA